MRTRSPLPPPAPFIPTKAELAQAANRFVPDLIALDLKVLFCGINPGLYSAAVGHHFARPGNRFWPALHAGGFTSRVLSPFEGRLLLADGLGITNVVERTSVTAAELTPEELVKGGKALRRKVRRYRPRWLAVLGVGAYRAAFGQPRATTGLQAETIGACRIWVLPNPSGLNAHYHPPQLAKMFAQFRQAIVTDAQSGG